ncbi:restriction endonuclease subunit S [Oceanospirillum sediminis]|uniref:Restriction endonuclease subunit S n=1 Tax=Oceanospirillum sediminis TaxID=2760088 RepID=A0A839IQ56_9GAMM|nr:restriction endonuclease subunit S [Oceanospirillum sediminis]MBB1487633.1 restriction endonuclease subunit S [Oceanospirillum sediminis]
MGSEWQITTLGKICSKITDGSHQSPKSVLNGMPMASVKDLNHWGIDLNSARHISYEDYEILVKQGCKPSVGDVLVAKDGNSALDTVCVVTRDDEVVLLSSVAILRPILSDIDPWFLKYYFMSPQVLSYLKNNFISGAAIPRVILKDFKQAEILLPTLVEQKKITNHLKSLDDRIDLNRQINHTLEQMAQTLFKSWFVDFDPVIDNALDAGNPIPNELQQRATQRKAVRASEGFKPLPDNIRQLFPDQFEKGELGSMPKGWDVKQLTDLGRVVCGKTPSKKVSEYYGGQVSFIKIPDMHGNVFITKTSDNLSPAGSESQINKLIPKGSICVSCIATVGLVSISTSDAHTNQQINSLIPECDYHRNYLYFSLIEKKDHFHDLASGGSATLNMNTSTFSKVKVLCPSENILRQFQMYSDPLLNKLLKNIQEIVSLESLRDTLLPKLISGELRLDQLDIDAGNQENISEEIAIA